MRILFIISILTFSLQVFSQGINFQLNTIENKQTDFQSIRGNKITVFDFWATWCKPCVQLMPKLNQIAEEYKENKAISIVGVNIDDPRSINKVKPFINSIGVTYPVLYDTDKELADMLNVSAVPTMVIVDDEGNAIWFHEGYNFGDEELLKEKINELLTTK